MRGERWVREGDDVLIHLRFLTQIKYMTKYERARILGTRALQIRY